jgi:predicted O-methyltransferase YrrM
MAAPAVLAKAVLLTRDEHDLIDDWVDFYAALFDAPNLVIVDNGSTHPGVLASYERFRARGVQVRVDASPFRDATAFMTRHIRDIADAPDAPRFILPLETDEFMFLTDASSSPSPTPSPSQTRALTREAIHAALRAVPEDVTVVRYAAFLGSIVDVDAPGYEPSFGFRRPARQMSRFFDQGWDKLILRADAFDRMTMWCHHAACKPGVPSRTEVCASLGLLHFHETGFRRQVERSVRVLQSFPYVSVAGEEKALAPNLSPGELQTRLEHAARARRAAVPCGHKVEYYDVLLRRRAVLRAFRDALGRLPLSPNEMDAYAEADTDMEQGGPSAAVRRAVASGALSVFVMPPVPQASQASQASQAKEWHQMEDWDALLFWDGGLAQGVSIRQAGRSSKEETISNTQVVDFFARHLESEPSAAAAPPPPTPMENPAIAHPLPEMAVLSPTPPPSPSATPQQTSDGPATFEAALAKYASTNNATGTDKTTGHAYGPLYTALFAPYKHSARRVLEIGIYSGASVAAMADFFVHARIVGIDITLANVRFGQNDPRITFRMVDGTSDDAPRLLGGAWDVVLDDASHRPEDQLRSFELFGPHVRAGGVYVIEDISGRDNGGAALQASLRAAATKMGYAKFEWHDLRDRTGQFDDIVAVMYA